MSRVQLALNVDDLEAAITFYSRLFNAEQVQSSDVVITMGCGDACPYFPGVSYRNWKLPDPAGQPLDVVRMIRDDIADRVQALIAELLATAKTR